MGEKFSKDRYRDDEYKLGKLGFRRFEPFYYIMEDPALSWSIHACYETKEDKWRIIGICANSIIVDDPVLGALYWLGKAKQELVDKVGVLDGKIKLAQAMVVEKQESKE